MSAIGDYIHWKASNYNKFGITRNIEQKETYKYQTQKENIKTKLKLSGFSDETKLKNALESILSTKDNSNENVARLNIQSMIEQILEDRFQETLGRINWDTGNIQAQTKKTANLTTNAINTDKNKYDVELNTILSRVRAIEKIRDSITNIEEEKKITDKINQIYRDLNFIITKRKTGIISKLKTGQIKNRRIDKNEASNIVTDINTILKTYIKAPPINLQKGDLFEYIIGLAPAMAKIQAKETLDKAFESIESMINSVVGTTERSRIEINFDKKNFTEDLNLEKLKLNRYTIDSTGRRTAISYGTSQGKIDIKLTWNDGKVYPVSAKNVNLRNDKLIHILSGSSLLYLIQDENHDFVNHYLNVVATHGDDIQPNGLKEAHEAMKYTLFFKALSGQTYGRKGATLFIVNDNSTGAVGIYDIAKLVEKAEKNIGLIRITVNGQNDGIDLTMMKINNPYNKSGSYSDRITKFISNVHNQKIYAALNPSLLTAE